MSNRDYLICKMKELGVDLTIQQVEQFELFYADLIKKNSVMNLTAITTWEDVVIKHFVDSLAIVKIGGMLQKPLRVMDVGTGAGFPGIPLAILFPDIHIVMVDSVGKKITFLKEEIEKMGFSHVSAVHGRVEDLARQPEYREKFDYCVSRAVANLSTLSEYCLPFVKKGGSFVAYKSGNCQEELDAAEFAIRELSGKIKRVEKYQISGSADENEIVTVPSERKAMKESVVDENKIVFVPSERTAMKEGMVDENEIAIVPSERTAMKESMIDKNEIVIVPSERTAMRESMIDEKEIVIIPSERITKKESMTDENDQKSQTYDGKTSGSISRTLIEIKKIGKTPLKYPRKAGIPSKSPLSE